MAKKGRMVYVPSIVIEEVEDIKREDDIFQGVEAMRRLVKYARVGREVNRMRNLDWSRKVKLPDIVETNLNNKNKRKSLMEEFMNGGP